MVRFAIAIMVCAVIFAMMVPSDLGHSPPPDAAQPMPAHSASGESAEETSADEAYSAPVVQSAQSEETVIERGGDGQFHVDVDVNSHRLPFLVDTGADVVALTVNDARMMGLYVDPAEFRDVGKGAGGLVRGQPVTLDTLSVAGHEMVSVQAVVLEGLETNLLGQSVLRQMAKVELAGDRMTIR